MNSEKKISAIPIGGYGGPKPQSDIMINNHAGMIARVNLVLVIWFLLKNFVGRKRALSTLVLWFKICCL